MRSAGIRDKGLGIRVENAVAVSTPVKNENSMDLDLKTATPVAAQIVNSITPAKMTLAEVRAKLEGQTGRRYWKNLDELAETPAFQELMQEEFPRQAGAGEWIDPVSRRGFLR